MGKNKSLNLILYYHKYVLFVNINFMVFLLLYSQSVLVFSDSICISKEMTV